MKHLLSIIALSIILTSCNAVKESSQSETADYFKVEIEQDGKIVKEKNNIVLLEKKPFKFKLTYFKTDNVCVSASWDKHYYDYPDDKNIFECNDDSDLEDCRFVAVKTGNEDKFNVNKDIYVGDGSYQFAWFYKETMDWHRMDKDVRVEDGKIYATVTVENIYDLDKRDTWDFEESEYNYPIGKINQDIYMVFATDHYESGMENSKELQREKFILKFK